MWKRDDNVRPPSGTREPAVPPTQTTPGAPVSHGSEAEAKRHGENRDVVNIGKSVVIKGELNGSEDLTVEGQVEGKVELKEHVLTIGPHGRIRAAVFAKCVVVLGEVTGDITASDKVDIRDNGSVDGNILAPRVAIAEGAHFRGSVDMGHKAEAVKPADVPKVDVKPPVSGTPLAPKV
jgi:cytoskeletal protein CcmA (bactofilin family)